MMMCLCLGACGDENAPSTLDSGPADTTTPDAQTNAQSWVISSDISVNGKNLGSDARSAITRVMDLGEGPVTVVQVTSAEDYCEMLKADGCLADGELLLTFEIYGDEPGSYPLSSSAQPEHMNASFVSIDRDCRGAGIGPSMGWVDVHDIDLEPGGSVDMEFGLTLLVGSVAGTVTAPWCEVPPS